MRRLRPLTGQVLIEVLPPPTQSAGGVALPDERPLSPDFVQESSRSPEKPDKNHIGIVRALGAWPKLKNGMLQMPEFAVGAKVVFNPWHGTALAQGQRLHRLVPLNSVLAVLP